MCIRDREQAQHQADRAEPGIKIEAGIKHEAHSVTPEEFASAVSGRGLRASWRGCARLRNDRAKPVQAGRLEQRGQVLFFGMTRCKFSFFRRILFRRCYIAWGVGRSVAGGVFAGWFRGRLVKPDEAESTD